MKNEWICASVLLFWLVGCEPARPLGSHETELLKLEESKVSSPLIIRLGETGEVFQKRISSGVHVNRQPAGINFYGLDWDREPYAWVRFVQGDHSIDIHHVNGAQTSEDLEVFKEEGFTEWTVHALLDPKKEIRHEEAAAGIHKLLRAAMDAGWKQYVDGGDPRLRDQARLSIVLEGSAWVGLDARHEPSLHDWMKIPDRTPCVESDQLAKWREVLPAVFKRAAAQRAEEERALRARGLEIDEGYADSSCARF